VLQTLAFLVLISLPLGLFGAYAALFRKWPFGRLTPYAVLYIGAITAIMGTALGIRGWNLLLVVSICMFGTWIGWRYWARALER
jgi:hypothetical protein